MTFAEVTMILAVAASLCSSTDGLQVVAPSEGMAVIANQPYRVEWTGASNQDIFEIDLRYCGSYSFCFVEDDCGFFIADLCGEGGTECIQEESTAEVVFPEPVASYSGDGYKVKISQVGTEETRCSEGFYLLSSTDATVGEATLEVVSPTSDSMAIAGEEYTVEFDYDNGFGSRVGRFRIDLYASGGSGDCGTFITSICDKADKGCHDTRGNYDVTIPESTLAGLYVIRVGVFGDDSVYDCSETFEVVAPGEDMWT